MNTLNERVGRILTFMEKGINKKNDLGTSIPTDKEPGAKKGKSTFQPLIDHAFNFFYPKEDEAVDEEIVMEKNPMEGLGGLSINEASATTLTKLTKEVDKALQLINKKLEILEDKKATNDEDCVHLFPFPQLQVPTKFKLSNF
ncbi:uncharacterized protein G2W53_033505 [Senna tora]|uniref:Uncharacterized protein n=1 Tax=Senna tora TaxID=362788 RepID=A0A834SYL9_9FABA|nr:uncharacterized protein G2W53_033505 [Senna tora]